MLAFNKILYPNKLFEKKRAEMKQILSKSEGGGPQVGKKTLYGIPGDFFDISLKTPKTQ